MSNSSQIQKIKENIEEHYKIERYCDRNVYKGIDRNTKELVSFNIIYNLLESKYNIWKVLEEIQKNSSFKHENIARLVNIKISNQVDKFESVILVMERLDTDLSTIIKSKIELSVNRRRSLMFQILQGLKYLHMTNISHKYLRPEKIMVNSNSNLLKIDALNYDTHFYSHWYRSPESLMNCYDNGTFSTDIWSAGCILYEMIARKPLFQCKNVTHQLPTIVKTIGSPTESDLHFVHNQKQIEYINSLTKVDEVDWEKLVAKGTSDEVDLIKMMLKWDPSKRISVEEAMKHPYFKLLHDSSDQTFCSPIDITSPQRMAYDKLPVYLWNKIQEIREEKQYK